MDITEAGLTNYTIQRGFQNFFLNDEIFIGKKIHY